MKKSHHHNVLKLDVTADSGNVRQGWILSYHNRGSALKGYILDLSCKRNVNEKYIIF